MINKVEICGVNTAKLPVLSNEEKEALFIEIKNGDEKAREKFIHGNLRLVLSVIKRFYGRGENVDDLFQVGCIGLIKAIDNFDVTLNVQFSTYAVPMIVGEIRRYLRDNNSIRVSRSIRDLAYRVLSAKEKLTKQNEKEPTIEEIAKGCNLSKEDVVTAIESLREVESIYRETDSSDGKATNIIDKIEDENKSEDIVVDKMFVEEILDSLNETERKIIVLRYFQNKTQAQIAEIIGKNQVQVSRMEKKILLNLKKKFFK